jgi:hypothetical protein
LQTLPLKKLVIKKDTMFHFTSQYPPEKFSGGKNPFFHVATTRIPSSPEYRFPGQGRKKFSTPRKMPSLSTVTISAAEATVSRVGKGIFKAPQWIKSSNDRK